VALSDRIVGWSRRLRLTSGRARAEMLGSSFSGRLVDEEVDERRLLLDVVLSSSICPPAKCWVCRDVP